MNIFRSSISSVSTSAAAAGTSTPATPPSSAPPRGSISTFAPRKSQPVHQTPPTTTSSSSSSSAAPNRIISSFNPTQTYHIPSHGGFLSACSTPLQILDLTPLLRNRKTASDPYSDRKAFKREVRHILASRRVPEPAGVGLGVEATMFLRRAKGGGGRTELHDVDSGAWARWRVPWALWRGCRLTIAYPSQPEHVSISIGTHDFDPRSQVFEFRGASYRWKFATPRELVLEKSAHGVGRYIVAVFYLTVSSAFFPHEIRAWAESVVKRGLGTTEGTLLFDSRGVERVLVMATVLVALKRERQRWSVLGGTI